MIAYRYVKVSKRGLNDFYQPCDDQKDVKRVISFYKGLKKGYTIKVVKTNNE